MLRSDVQQPLLAHEQPVQEQKSGKPQACSPDLSHLSAESTQEAILMQRLASGSLVSTSQPSHATQEQISRFRSHHIASQQTASETALPVPALFCGQQGNLSHAQHVLRGWPLSTGAQPHARTTTQEQQRSTPFAWVVAALPDVQRKLEQQDADRRTSSQPVTATPTEAAEHHRSKAPPAEPSDIPGVLICILSIAIECLLPLL
jgi:hypothetical protein